MNAEKIAKKLGSVLSKIEIEAPQIPYKWADEHFHVVKGTSDTPGPWVSFGYQKGLIGLFAGNAAIKVVLKKCKRIGGTQCLKAAWAKMIIEQRRSVCVWHPVAEDSKDFVTDEINPLFEVMPGLQKALDGDWKNKKERNNTDSKKKFLGCTAYFRGGKSERAYRQITISIAFIDELDGFFVGPDGYAEYVERAFGRTETSMNRKIVINSTVRVKGQSLTEKEYDSCEIHLYRYIKCPHCGELHRLDWENFKYEKNADATLAVDAYFICPECKKEYRYDDYPEADEHGEWRTEDGIKYDEENDVFIDDEGSIVYKYDSVGVMIWSAYSYFLSWTDLASEWIKANLASATGDYSKLRTFINEMLAQTYEERAGSVSSSLFASKIEKYNWILLPEKIQDIVAGCDVQTGENARVEITVVGFGEANERWVIEHRVLEIDISHENTWGKLDNILLNSYETEDGRTIPISVALIDEGDGNVCDSVRRYCYSKKKLALLKGELRRVIRPCKGTGDGASIDVTGKDYGDHLTKTRVRVHRINQISMKDTIFGNLVKVKQPGPEYTHFPENLDQDYYNQLTGERRVVQNKRVKYVKKSENHRVEALDCMVYALGAYSIRKAVKKRLG